MTSFVDDVEETNQSENNEETLESIKDEQTRFLSEQNRKLLEVVQKRENEINAVELTRSRLLQENEDLREARLKAESQFEMIKPEFDRLTERFHENETRLKSVTVQHAEVVKLLEEEEEKNAKLSKDLINTETELRDLKVEHSRISNDLKSAQEDVAKFQKHGQLQSEEILLLRKEIEMLKSQQDEENLRSRVELESLQEQLGVRKEKQYQLLEKLQYHEGARIQAETKFASMEEKISELELKLSSAENQLQIEINSKETQEEHNTKLRAENLTLLEKNKKTISTMQKLEKDHLRMETAARESGEQLREMAEKVFQLLERLKLAELGKKRSLEALRTKEEEFHGLKRKYDSIEKEHSKQARLRMQVENEKSALEDQITMLKKQNVQLGHRCKDEARLKVKVDEQKREAETKIDTLNSRITFLLNKLQTDEQAKNIVDQQMVKLQKTVEEYTEKKLELQSEVESFQGTIKELEAKLREKESEIKSMRMKLEALQKVYEHEETEADSNNTRQLSKGETDDPLLAGGRLRFFVENKSQQGIFMLKAKCSKDRDWLEKNQCNLFMKKVSKSQNKLDISLNKIAETYGIIMTQEEEMEKLILDLENKVADMEKMSRKLAFLHERLSTEEESKRRTLLKYINAVKASVSLGEQGCERYRDEVGKIGAGMVQLPEVRTLILFPVTFVTEFVRRLL
jgi:myosin protein heavy chain